MGKVQAAERESFAAEKTRAALVSVVFNFTSTIVKFLGAVLTGSVSLLSEAVHSATDIVASMIALLSVRAATAPPDEEHPFGHGKIESLAGFGEAIMLFAIVVYIVIAAFAKLLARTAPAVERIDIGLYIVGAAALAGLAVARYVVGVGKRTHSLALISNGQHLTVDLVTTVGVFLGLMITRFTGWTYADPLVAIAVAIWIAIAAYRMSVRAFHELIDVRLPRSELQHIRKLLESEPGLLSFHRLRTRRVGSIRNIDLHIVVPREWTVVQAHDLADHLEKLLCRELAPAEVVIHVDPYDPVRGR